MNGWMRLTRVNGKKINLNPIQISWFAEATDDLTSLYGAQSIPGATAICIGAMMIQVQETEREVQEMYVRLVNKLIKKQHNSVLDLRKRLDREEWQEEEE